MRKNIFVTNSLKNKTKFKESIHAKHNLTPPLYKNIWSSDSPCSALASQTFSLIIITSSRSQPPSRQHTHPTKTPPHTRAHQTKTKQKPAHAPFNTKKEKRGGGGKKTLPRQQHHPADHRPRPALFPCIPESLSLTHSPTYPLTHPPTHHPIHTAQSTAA